jgi:hypothetical protein
VLRAHTKTEPTQHVSIATAEITFAVSVNAASSASQARSTPSARLRALRNKSVAQITHPRIETHAVIHKKRFVITVMG